MSLYDAAPDYTAPPSAVAGEPDRPRGPLCACCSTVIRASADRTYTVPGISQLHHRSSRLAGTISRTGPQWRAAITIDQPQRVVEVRVRVGAVNATGDTRSYPMTRPLSAEAFAREMPAIKSAIERAWNKPYTLVVVDDKCGEQRFRVSYVVELAVVARSWGHFTITFINVPGDNRTIPPSLVDPQGLEVWRSWVSQPTRTGKFNLGEGRSASSLGSGRNRALEAHEFGHILGLWDEYEEFRDYNSDGDGTDGVVGGRLEADRGGIQYTFCNGHTEVALPNANLMSNQGTLRAEPARYTVPVQYAVKQILTEQGRRISAIYTVGQG